MIEERARVVAVRPGGAWVEVTRRSACGTCHASAGCGTAVVAKLFGDKVNRLHVADTLGVRVGDRVVIGIADGTLTRASLAAYMLPLLALMIVALLAQSAGASEEGSALLGIVGLGVGLWVTGRLTGGAAGRERYRPTLLRKVEPGGIAVPGPELLN